MRGMALLHDTASAGAELRLRPLGAAWRAAAPRDYLLLLSHMRSYSSLLAHLLGASPEVDGYGETQLRYRSPLDLLRLRWDIRRSTGAPLQGRWLLDKQLHNRIHAIDRWVPAQRVRALIFIREPGPTLNSLLALAQANGGGQPLADPQRACDYYVSRLHRLREDGERLGRRAGVFDAEQLLRQPEPLLAAIAGFLGLREVPAASYRPGRRTGEDGYGDPSPRIQAGRVLAPRQAAGDDGAPDGPPLPAEVLAEARAAWQRCRAALWRCATPLG